MKKLLIVLVLLLGCFMGGCDGVMYNRRGRSFRNSMIVNHQSRVLVDDIDYFWLFERNTRFSEWHYRVGI